MPEGDINTNLQSLGSVVERLSAKLDSWGTKGGGGPPVQGLAETAFFLNATIETMTKNLRIFTVLFSQAFQQWNKQQTAAAALGLSTATARRDLITQHKKSHLHAQAMTTALALQRVGLERGGKFTMELGQRTQILGENMGVFIQHQMGMSRNLLLDSKSRDRQNKMFQQMAGQYKRSTEDLMTAVAQFSERFQADVGLLGMGEQFQKMTGIMEGTFGQTGRPMAKAFMTMLLGSDFHSFSMTTALGLGDLRSLAMTGNVTMQDVEREIRKSAARFEDFGEANELNLVRLGALQESGLGSIPLLKRMVRFLDMAPSQKAFDETSEIDKAYQQTMEFNIAAIYNDLHKILQDWGPSLLGMADWIIKLSPLLSTFLILATAKTTANVLGSILGPTGIGGIIATFFGAKGFRTFTDAAGKKTAMGGMSGAAGRWFQRRALRAPPGTIPTGMKWANNLGKFVHKIPVIGKWIAGLGALGLIVSGRLGGAKPPTPPNDPLITATQSTTAAVNEVAAILKEPPNNSYFQATNQHLFELQSGMGTDVLNAGRPQDPYAREMATYLREITFNTGSVADDVRGKQATPAPATTD